MKKVMNKFGRIIAALLAFAMVVTGVPNVGPLKAIEAKATTTIKTKTITFWSGANNEAGKKSVADAFPDPTPTSASAGNYAIRGAGAGYAWIDVISSSGETKIKDNYSIQINTSKSNLRIVVPVGGTNVKISSKVSSGSTSSQGKIKCTYKSDKEGSVEETILSETSVTKTAISTTDTINVQKEGDASGTYTFIPTAQKVCFIELSLTYDYEACAVSFDSQNGDDPTVIDVAKGAKVTRPKTNPTKTGFIFDDWYTTADGDVKFDFNNTAISDETTIYAHWKEAFTATVASDEGGHGTIKLRKKDSEEEVDEISDVSGTKVEVIGKPADGYTLDFVTIDGVEVVAAADKAEFTLTKNVEVVPTFITVEEKDAKTPKWTVSGIDDEDVTVTVSSDGENYGAEIAAAKPGDKVYVNAVAKDAAKYISEVSYKKELDSESTSISEEKGKYSFNLPVMTAEDEADHKNIKVSALVTNKPTVTVAGGVEGIVLSAGYGLKDEKITVTVAEPEGKILKSLTYKVGSGEEQDVPKENDEYVIEIKNNNDNIVVSATYLDREIVLNAKDVISTCPAETALASAVSFRDDSIVLLTKCKPQATINASLVNTDEYPYSICTAGSGSNTEKAIKINLIDKAMLRVVAGHPNGDGSARGVQITNSVASSGASTGSSLAETLPGIGLYAYDLILEGGTYYIAGFKPSSGSSPNASISVYEIDINYNVDEISKANIVFKKSEEDTGISVKGTIGQKLVSPYSPTKDGYTFLGWFNGDQKWDFDSDVVPEQGVTLTAGWEEAKYSLTIEANGEVTSSVEEGQYVEKVSPGNYNAIANKDVKVNVEPTDPTKEANKAVKRVYVVNSSDPEATPIEAKRVDDRDVYTFTMPTYAAVIKVETAVQYKASVAESIENATVKTDKENYFADDKVKITAEPAEGYYIKEVLVGDDAIEGGAGVNDPTKAKGETLKPGYEMPAKDITVSATAAPIDYIVDKKESNTTVTINESNTTVSENGMRLAHKDAEISFTVDVNEGCTLSSVTVHDTVTDTDVNLETPVEGPYKFIMPAGSVEIKANAGLPQKLTVAEVEHGRVSYSPETVYGGTQVTLTTKPDEGYRVQRDEDGKPYITVGETNVYASEDNANEFKFEMPNAATIATVKFEEIPKHTVTFDMGDHGTAIDAMTVTEGENLSSLATPTEEGYEFVEWTNFEKVKVDDKTYPSYISYDLSTPITKDIKLFAIWKKDITGYTQAPIFEGMVKNQVYGADDVVSFMSRAGFRVITGGIQSNDSKNGGVDKDGLVVCPKEDVKLFLANKISATADTRPIYYVELDADAELPKAADEPKGDNVSKFTVTTNKYEENEIELKANKKYFITLAGNGNISFANLAYKVIEKCTVTFDTQVEGITVEPKKVLPGGTITAPTAPVREGYVFEDWYTDSECTEFNKFDFATPITEDITLYAKWTEKTADTYTVTVVTDIANGTISATPTTATAGTKITLSATPADGYRLKNYVVTGAEVIVAADGTFTMPAANVIVSAVFEPTSNPEPTKVTVTFNANGHGTAPASITVDENTKVTVPTAPEAAGWIFGGWYTEAACTTLFDFDTEITANITLYAKWTEKIAGTYTVTFDANGHGTAPASIPNVTKDSKVTAPTAPTATGFTFGGWFTDKECTTLFDFNTGITADITLYAKWTQNAADEYSIKVLTNVGGIVSANKVTAKKDETITLSNKANEGYTFDSYIVKDAAGKSVAVENSTFKMPASNVTVSGNFIKNAPGPKPPVEEEGLTLEWLDDVEVVNGKAQYTYTGSPIVPNVSVRFNGENLMEGTDYTLAVKNNTAISAGAAAAKRPVVIVTGKGAYGQKGEFNFDILKADIKDATIPSTLKVKAEAKIDVKIAYNGVALKNGKDYKLSKEKANKSGELVVTVTGQGNFMGTTTFTVVTGTPDPAISAKFNSVKLYYTGADQAEAVKAKVIKEVTANKKALKKDAYVVSIYPEKVVDAGNYTVVVTPAEGTSASGYVAKKITVNAISAGKAVDEGKFIVINNGKVKNKDAVILKDSAATYSPLGAKADVEASLVSYNIVKYKNGSETVTAPLVAGKDYTVTFSGNKKAGENIATATLKLKGNFKGSIKTYYTINKADITEATIVSANAAIYDKKPLTAFKGKIFVDVDNVTVKASEYTTTFYTEDPAGKSSAELKKIELSKTHEFKMDNSENEKLLYFRIEGKKVNYAGVQDGSVLIQRKPAKTGKIKDASKLKIAVVNKSGAALKSLEYTGEAITVDTLPEGCRIEVKDGTKKLSPDNYDITLVNNKEIGKASIVVNGKGAYAGSSVGTIAISAYNCKNGSAK